MNTTDSQKLIQFRLLLGYVNYSIGSNQILQDACQYQTNILNQIASFSQNNQLKLSNFLSDYISELKMMNTSVITIANYFNSNNIKSLQNA